jgi:hypothetical protein
LPWDGFSRSPDPAAARPGSASGSSLVSALRKGLAAVLVLLFVGPALMLALRSVAATAPRPTAGPSNVPSLGVAVLGATSMPSPSPPPAHTPRPSPSGESAATDSPTAKPTEPAESPPAAKPTDRPTDSSATPEPTRKPKPPAFTGGVSGAYGSAQGDSRNNHHIGGSAHAILDFRFRATTSSPAESLRVQQRGGPGYSGGDGGRISVTIESDDGGHPSGEPLASLTFAPGNPSGNWEGGDRLTFSSSATLTRGRVYHLVFTNVAADPARDYISLNDLFYWGSESPRQPTFSNDFAVLYKEGRGWELKGNDAPIFDLTYANGEHDGMAYIGSLPDHYGVISGGSNMVRQHFTVSGSDRAVTSASVKVKRINGSAPLTLTLQKGSRTVVSNNVPASAIALGNLPTVHDASHLGGNTWATIEFPDLTLESGVTYNLVVSTEGDTMYIAVPLQEGADKGLRSYRFTDGAGQRTTDGGASWSPLYLWSDVDLQFVLR